MLSGAGLVKGNSSELVHFHQTSNLIASSTDGSIDLTNALEPGETVDIDAPLFILATDEGGDLTGEMITGYYTLDSTNTKLVLTSNGEQSIATVDQSTNSNTSNWDVVIATETNTLNDGQDWRYAQPLTKTQVIRADGMDYYITGFSTSSGTLAVSDQPAKKIRYSRALDVIPELDALYLISDDLTVIPYNLSHLQIAVTLETEKAQEAELYPLNVTITGASAGEPTLGSDANQYLTNVTTIKEYIGTKEKINDAITLLAKYLVGGKDALIVTTDDNGDVVTDTTATARNETIVKAFLTIQAALQYYTYSYIKNYTKIVSTGTHTHAYSSLDGLQKFLGFTTIAVFDALNSSTAKAYVYDAVNKKYSAITEETKNAYYAGRGLVAYNMLKSGYANSKAFKETAGKAVMVDYYVMKAADTVSELQIDAANFAGYYYVEADTLFRRQIDGVDLPANITFPNVKIQSNFTFSMAPTGDPSTFTFTMDAMPGYTYFDKTKKVLCAIQIVDDKETKKKTDTSIFAHPAKVGKIDVSVNDSIPERYSE